MSQNQLNLREYQPIEVWSTAANSLLSRSQDYQDLCRKQRLYLMYRGFHIEVVPTENGLTIGHRVHGKSLLWLSKNKVWTLIETAHNLVKTYSPLKHLNLHNQYLKYHNDLFSVPDALKLLKARADDLEHLSLAGFPISEGHYTNLPELVGTEVVELPHLKVLEVDVLPLLAFLRCPALKVLKCNEKATVDVSSWTYAGFHAFLKSCVNTAERFEVAAKFQQSGNAALYERIKDSLSNQQGNQSAPKRTNQSVVGTRQERPVVTRNHHPPARTSNVPSAPVEDEEHPNKRRRTDLSPGDVGQGAEL
eukprot:GHVU01124902.1.p1 GENE.GHVU01124902.1~~GHVU01124902.1.p1  ORF type:complete len:306 (-),score=28.08 GHVU01124902.1:817-1734(-)